jgi:type II secretory pathway pseudopilin PulG
MLLGKALKRRKGFGIVEVLVSAAVLGFLYLAVMQLQLGNRQTLQRIRGRDGAVEVAQLVLDSLQAVGAAAIESARDDETIAKMPDYDGNPDYVRTWERCNNQNQDCVVSEVKYFTKITVMPDNIYFSKDTSLIDSVKHVYAKNVKVDVSWRFKGSIQSVSVSGVIR